MLAIPNISKYRNGEFVKYIANIITIGGNHDLATLNLAEKHSALEPLYTKLTAVFKQDRGSDLTREIIELDKTRDSDYNGIRGVVGSYASHHHDEATKNLAAALLKVLESHGSNLARLSYQEQTAATEDIVNKVEQNHADALSTLNLTGWFNHMKTTNQQFNTTFLARNKEYAEAPQEKLAELRDETTAALQEFIKFTNAYATINDTGAYDALINEVNALTHSYDLVVSRRLGSSTATTTEEEESLDADFDEVG